MPASQPKTPLQKVQEAYAGAYYEWQGVTASKQQLETQMASPAAINDVAERERQAKQVASLYNEAVQEFQRANAQTLDDLRTQPRAQTAYNTARSTHQTYIERYPTAPEQSSIAQGARMTDQMAAGRGGQSSAQQPSGQAQGPARTHHGPGQ
ncbi:hypothetical protein ACGFMO_21985 [Streptomyces niveus]|jgi:hypothetical protein|uniref:hypothetical protein n=1 Tax=Streptomyces niveus TaxID=193462 RepID=UPI00371AAE87